MCTAGPQPGTFPAQCALLDLNGQIEYQKICQIVLEDMSDRMPEDMPEHIAEDMPGRMPEDMPDRMPEDMLDKMPEDMSDRMPEDLPVTKRINVMVGITRSKVISALRGNIE